MFSSLITRVIVATITLLIGGVFIYASFNVKHQQDILIENARESTELLLHTVESSIFNTMHLRSLGYRQDVNSILSMVGQHNQLVGVRIFHPHGVILNSSIHGEIGRMIAPDVFRISASLKNYGIFNLSPHGEILSMVKPIYNEVACHACHGSKARVIGILNINYSLNHTKIQMLHALRIYIVSSILITVFLSIMISLILLKLVKRPLDKMINTMSEIEQGDLNVRIDYKGKDEIGRLIVSFNSMVSRLNVAKQELEQLHFEQLERADRLASIGEMAAGIAHEIKNPLAGISAAVSVIRDDMQPDDPREPILGEVLEQIQRLDKTVRDLLFFGRPSLPELTCVDVNNILTKTIRFAAQHRSEASIEQQIDLEDGLSPIYADENQIQQVFLNLILNALQAMPTGGTLLIRTSRSYHGAREFVRVDFSDSGCGIPQQILERIFTPFFTTKAQGTGLGLPICSKLVKLHNGDISVISNPSGTVFTVELPAHNLDAGTI
ncbi:MAG: ATP-binding protein [Desulfuromonadales bacterium]